jgi:hypothetical protein
MMTAGRGLGVTGLVLAVVAGLAAIFAGTDVAGSRNVAPVLLWVGFWLVVPFAGAVAGNIYTAINPWRSLARLAGVGGPERPELVERLGVLPAALALVAFAWMELVWPDGGAPGTVAAAALAYTGYLLSLSTFAGPETALTSSDLFTVYNRLLSSIAPFGRGPDGRLAWRGWLRALPVLPDWKGMWIFVVAMIGTVSFDGLSSGTWYGNLDPFWASMPGATLGLVGSTVVVGGAYGLASIAAARLGGGRSPSEVAARFAHTLVPIALAYAVAHYFTLILFEGQQVISSVSDPFGLGWDLFGTRGYKINFFLAPEAIWYIQVAAIVGGHLTGVVLAHDRALSDFPGASAVRSQYAMLVLMVCLTGLGLLILAG